MRGLYTERITDVNHINMLKSVLESINPTLLKQIDIERFHDNGEGVDRAYNVYKIISNNQTYILKKSDNNEIEVYEKFFPFPFYMTDEYRNIFLKGVYDNLTYKPDYKQFIFHVILSCLNECIEFIESELNDESIERDEPFIYYYKNAETLANIILNGMEQLNYK